MLPGFFDVTPVELEQLGAEPAVGVLREMIFAEVGGLGIPVSEIDIPYSNTTPDGGVDAVVRGIPTKTGNGVIFAPRTSYQVKAGDFPLNSTSFARIEELLLKPSSIERRVKLDSQSRENHTQPTTLAHEFAIASMKAVLL